MRVRAWAVAVAASLVAAGCGGSGSDAGCGPVITELEDPASGVHLLPGAPEPTYLSDPPTSGPHTAGPPLTGVLDEPLPRPRQVGLLEAGAVIIHVRDPARLEDLAPLASGDRPVVITPAPDLDDPIVATAWRTRMTCRTPDTDALARFIDDHAGRGPGHG